MCVGLKIPEHCCDIGKFLTLEKPGGFLKLEMGRVFKGENCLYWIPHKLRDWKERDRG